MKILIVRHADPDYEIDGLTPIGRLEADALVPRLCPEGISAIYCSTLGRARLTAQPTAEALGIEVRHFEWLREFSYAEVKLPYVEKAKCCWDLLPEFANEKRRLYDPEGWREEDFIKDSSVAECYDEVCRELDSLLAKHGYVREGYNYKAVKPNHDVIALFCHFGVGAVLLSHLLNCSPYSIWQHTVLLPSSVTSVYTEERRDGVALMRASAIGDLSHLYAAGLEPSFSARFCECYADDTRHD